jgi:hypothetical protein
MHWRHMLVLMGNDISLAINVGVCKEEELVRKIVERHCFMYGHCEGGRTFRPMVS